MCSCYIFDRKWLSARQNLRQSEMSHTCCFALQVMSGWLKRKVCHSSSGSHLKRQRVSIRYVLKVRGVCMYFHSHTLPETSHPQPPFLFLNCLSLTLTLSPSKLNSVICNHFVLITTSSAAHEVTRRWIVIQPESPRQLHFDLPLYQIYTPIIHMRAADGGEFEHDVICLNRSS